MLPSMVFSRAKIAAQIMFGRSKHKDLKTNTVKVVSKSAKSENLIV